MATVDLDALAAELRTAGYFAEDTHGDGLLKVGTNTHERYTAHCVVSREGDVHPSRNSKVDWTVFDIIRRYVSPEPSRRAAVDVDAVMALVREYAIACKAIADGSDYAVGEARNYRAAIRALLEPHDAARLRETIAKAIWDADRGYATSIPWPPVSEFREGQAYRIADAVIRAIGGAQ